MKEENAWQIPKIGDLGFLPGAPCLLWTSLLTEWRKKIKYLFVEMLGMYVAVPEKRQGTYKVVGRADVFMRIHCLLVVKSYNVHVQDDSPWNLAKSTCFGTERWSATNRWRGTGRFRILIYPRLRFLTEYLEHSFETLEWCILQHRKKAML